MAQKSNDRVAELRERRDEFTFDERFIVGSSLS